MRRTRSVASVALLFAITISAAVQRPQPTDYVPVTDEILRNPNAEDWLMFSRTYDAQRFSPLKEINKQNVSQLKLAWSRKMALMSS